MNRNININFFLMLLVAIAGATVSGAAKPKTYEDVPIPQMKLKMPEWSEFELPNGISGLVVEDHEVPLVDFYLAFTSTHDPADIVGRAEMVEWTLRNGGSLNIPADSLNEIIEFKAASLNFSGGQEQFYIYGGCLAEDLPLMLSLVRELIDHPAYPEEKIDLKRSTMLESIRRRYDRPYGIAYRELNRLLYPDHPWGSETSVTSVGAITRGDLLAYHSIVFKSSGAVIGVSGDVEPAEVQELAAEHFGSLDRAAEDRVSLPDVGEQAPAGVYYGYKDYSQAFVAAGHQAIKYDDPRRIAAEIMNYILGGGQLFQSLLASRIRNDEGLAYSVWSSYSTPYSAVGRFMAAAATRLEDAGRTLSLMEEIIAKYQSEGPTEEHFANAKKAFINSYVWENESSDQILRRLVYLKWRGLPLDTPQRDFEAYQQLTRGDVAAAATELLHPDKLVIVVVGDREKMDRPLEDFGEVTVLELKSETQ